MSALTNYPSALARIWACLPLFAAFFLCTPRDAAALSVVQAVGFFHIVVGLLLTGVLLTFATGFIMYVTRFNTWPSNRDEAIRVFEWAIAMLFVLIILIAIVDFFQNHTAIALPILAGILIIALAIVFIRVMTHKEEKKPAPPPRR